MEIGSQYDFVILGECPAGLWAALHLLSAGKKVLVIPMGVDSGNHPIPRSVARAFQIPESMETHRDLQPIQVITEGRRFRVFSDQTLFQDEYQFNYGKKLSADTPISSGLLRGLAYLAHGAETGPVFPDDAALILKRVNETLYFEKEKGFVTRLMLDFLKLKGASIAPLKSLKQIFFDRKTMVGVQLAGTSKMIAVPHAFSNTSFQYLSQYFNEKIALQSKPIAWKYEVRFECGTDFLPKGLTPRLVYVEAHAPILNILEESPGHFKLQTELPLNESSLDRVEQLHLAERMLKVVESLLPDLEYNLKRMSPDVRDPERATAIELPSLYPFQEMKRIPSERLIYGVGSALPALTPIEGFYICNEEANAKQGLWGAYIAVTQVMDQLAKREQKPEISRISL